MLQVQERKEFHFLFVFVLWMNELFQHSFIHIVVGWMAAQRVVVTPTSRHSNS